MSSRETFRVDVLTALRAKPRRIPSKYFYDERGSALFEEITALDEYYPTRVELRIFEDNTTAIAAAVGAECQIIEYGSGSGVKTRRLLELLESPQSYVPVEISGEYLEASAERLRETFPAIEIEPIHADYTQPFDLPEASGARRTVFFPGSTVGNFTKPEALAFLTQIARQVGSGGGLLIGVDLKKNPAILHAAYNDSKGVTAQFNLNLLRRINRELDADFDLDAFAHYAFYEPVDGRIEMHLVSQKEQTVRVSDHNFTFANGETLLTEYSYKYTPAEFDDLAIRAGLRRKAFWTDPNALFGVFYYEAG